MSEQLLHSTDYLVKQIALHSFETGQTIDLTGVMEQLNLYDSIYNPSISGNIIVRDAIGLIEKMPIVGNESITVILEKPGVGVKFEKAFRIYKVSDRKPIGNMTEMYTIHFCGATQIMSDQFKISKSYNHKTYSYMVNDILKNQLKLKDVIVEETIGNVDAVIPNMNPLEACQWIAKRSVSKSSVPSFLFFESLNDGHVFSTIDNLIENYNLGISYTETIQNIQSNTGSDRLFGINHSETDKSFNLLENIKSGTYASTNYGVDLVTLTIDKSVFDSSDFTKKIAHTNTISKLPDIKSIDGKPTYTQYSSNIRVTPSTRNQVNNPYVQSKNVFAFSNEMDKISVQRQHIIRSMFSNKIYLNVPGLQSLSAGRSIKVNFIDRNIRSKADADEVDSLKSGVYLITGTRHSFSPNGIYKTHLECSSDSYESKGGSQKVFTIGGEANYAT